MQVRGERPFADLADFAHRIDPQIVNRKALECLVQAGAFDSLDPDRAKLFANIGRILAAAQERSERSASGITDLFGGSGEPARLFLTAADPWPPAERLQREFAAVGTYLSAHPIDDYAALVAAARRADLEGVPRPAPPEPAVHRADRGDRGRSGRSGARAPAAASASSRSPTRPRSSRRPSIRSGLPTGASCWSPGHSLFLQIGGEYDPETEEVRARIQAHRAARGDGGARRRRRSASS